MKKLLGLLVCCFLLTGCDQIDAIKDKVKEGVNGGKEKVQEVVKKTQVLTCSKKTESTVNFVTNIDYVYEDEKLVRLGVNYAYDLSTLSEDKRKAFGVTKLCETDAIKSQLEMLDCEEELIGTDYIVKGYSEKMRVTQTGTLEEYKKSYTTNGWNCTVK